MKITRLESFSTQDVGFVRATCEDGSQGWGQFSPYNADITATVFHRQVARWAVCADGFDIDELIATIGEREHKFPGSYLCRAMTGLDTFISGITQSCRISVDEKGVSAASFTAINYAGAAMPEGSADMILERPFLFAVLSQEGFPLFIGVCADPSAE